MDRNKKMTEQALRDCYVLAQREIRRLESWRKDGGELTPIGMAVTTWEHIIRFCEEAGLEPNGILRGSSLDRDGKHIL